MKRTTKRYVVTTSSLNCYAFRLLTEGGDQSQYINNPIILWMHIRAVGNSKDQILPLGRAVDIKTEGDKITCYLEFDETDDFAMQIYNKYENGTLNMLSVGAKPIEISDDPALMLPGQVGPTVTKWLWVETSCVDIGGNPEAFGCQLYDADDNKIEMANLTPEGMIKLFNPLNSNKTGDNQKMKLLTLSAPVANAILLHLKLNEAATEADVQKAVADMVQLNLSQSAQIGTLTSEKETAESSLVTLQTKYDNEIKAANDAAIKLKVDTAVDKRLISRKDGDNLIMLADGKMEKVDKFLEGKVPVATIQQSLTTETNANPELAELVKLSYQELDKGGKLVRLKELDIDQFKAKYKDRYGVDYKG